MKRKLTAWRKMVLAFGRRCIAAKEVRKESVEMRRDLPAYMRKHNIPTLRSKKLVSVRFGAASGSIPRINCEWVHVGSYLKGKQICDTYEYQCGGRMVRFQDICRERTPGEELPEPEDELYP